jgi:alpha-beta hydrolase superfamily lysophospholipase
MSSILLCRYNLHREARGALGGHLRVDSRRRGCRLILESGAGRTASARPRCDRPDLPCDDSATLDEYADTAIEAIGGGRDLVVVGQSYGGFTVPLVADRVRADMLVLVAGMIPVPGEPPARWWDNTATTIRI